MDTITKENREVIEVLQDIKECISKHRLDDMMYSFIHLYPLINEQIKVKAKLDLLNKDIESIIKNIDLMNMIDLFYKVYDNADEGRLLLDPSVTDSEVYNLNEYKIVRNKREVRLYNLILNTKAKIIRQLGHTKQLFLTSGGFDFQF
jgi:hypothetical protein